MDESRPPDWTNLHWAIWTQDLESVKQILSAEGTDINAQDQLGWTPLHLACCSNSSRLWETGQLHPRGLNSQTGPGFDLTIRPGAIHRYKVLGYSSSSSTGPGDELDKSNLAESTVSFFIALELLQASAEVNTSHHHAPLHCAASSGWTDHVDALLNA
ncbi:hypothetical protein QBC44DRAFT_343014 [Cladorrhinum sp. PSN332]|nr:hypothetical protein QBC44DRAFT_343014 [Cladorrhinum sp. PSN332]